MARNTWRYPPRSWRIFLVAMVYLTVGCLAGAIVGTLLGGFLLGSLIGAIIGAAAGASMERGSNRPVKNEARIADERNQFQSPANSKTQSSIKSHVKQ